MAKFFKIGNEMANLVTLLDPLTLWILGCQICYNFILLWVSG